MALTQITRDQVKRISAEQYVDVRNNTGSTINAFTFVKANGDYSAGEIPTITAVTATYDIPVAFLVNNLLTAANTSHPSSTSKAISMGRIEVTGFNTTASAIGNPVYFTSAGVLTLTAGSCQVGIVLSLATNGVVYIDLNTYLSKSFYDASLECIIQYDTTRSKWLSDLIVPIDLGRSGTLGVGTSFRYTPDTPTSSVPLLLERDMCLVGIVASTSALEQYVIRVDDVSGGSGATLAINYEAAGPVSTKNFTKLDLNQNYNANDRLDVYVLSSATGNISNPRIRLLFRYRK